MPEISKVELFDHVGYICWSNKQGVFVYKDVGTFKGTPYSKIRLCLVWRDADGQVSLSFRKLTAGELSRKSPSHQKSIGINFELISSTKTMMDLALGETILGNQTYETTPEQAEATEMDALMKQVGGRGTRL